MNEEIALSLLQGAWKRTEDGDNYHIIISSKYITLEDGDIIELRWRPDVEQWVIPGGLEIRFLSIDEKGKLISYFAGNGPFISHTLIYSIIK